MSNYEDITYVVEDSAAIITINRRSGTTLARRPSTS